LPKDTASKAGAPLLLQLMNSIYRYLKAITYFFPHLLFSFSVVDCFACHAETSLSLLWVGSSAPFTNIVGGTLGDRVRHDGQCGANFRQETSYSTLLLYLSICKQRLAVSLCSVRGAHSQSEDYAFKGQIIYTLHFRHQSAQNVCDIRKAKALNSRFAVATGQLRLTDADRTWGWGFYIDTQVQE
jgi:hypothetical protein